MDVREMKEMLGDRAAMLIANGLGQKINKQGFILCPYHTDTHPSMSWFRAGQTFKCMVCGETLDIYKYYTDHENMDFIEAKEKVAGLLGIELFYKGEKKTYTKATESFYPPSANTIDFFKSRCIPENIVKKWDIQSRTKNGTDQMVFRHKATNGKVVLNAYRDSGSKTFEREAGNKSILYGMDRIDFKKPVVITEGPIDAISVSIVYDNVVSVPSGINNTDWIENCWAFIDKVDQFIFWADNDGKKGIELAEAIRARLGKGKCRVEYHEQYKDANELLMAEGKESLNDFIEEILTPTVEGMINMGRRRSTSNDILKFETGFYDIDRHLKGLEYGALTVVFGRDNEGKSTFISQLIAEQLKIQKVFLYSGEMSDHKIEDWVMCQIVSGDDKHLEEKIDKYGDKEIFVKEETKKAVRRWYRDRFFLLESKMESNVTKNLLNTMEQAFKVYGIRVFFIDNMMSACEDEDTETTKAEANFAKRLKKFALDHNAHIFLVAHPNKNGSVEHTPLTKVDVNGSKVITNIADYIIAVERAWNPKENENSNINEMYRMKVDGEKDKYYTTIIRLVKNRSKHARKDLFYRFHVKSARFYNSEVSKDFDKSWTKYLKAEAQTVKYYNGTEQTFTNGELTPDAPF